MSWSPEVIADSSGKYVGNQLRFEHKNDAETYAINLMWRWTLVTEWRVVESIEPVNCHYVDDCLVLL